MPNSDEYHLGIELTELQLNAVTCEGKDVLVTAGAGSGKTRTLVARYLWLLEQGFSPRQVLAITFTEKAAREMRNRVRQAVADQATKASSTEERKRWAELEAQMDAARIGTIHSLCAEILRAHPAEAEVDPEFEVLDEGLAAALKVQAVDQAVVWTTGDPEYAQLFNTFTTGRLLQLLSYLLRRRLEASDVLQVGDLVERAKGTLQAALKAYVEDEKIFGLIARLTAMRDGGGLVDEAGEKLAAQIEDLLDEWDNLEAALISDDLIEAARLLFTIRRRHLGLGAGKKSSETKGTLRQLRETYKERIAPWLGGESASDPIPQVDIEARFIQDLPYLQGLFQRAVTGYMMSLDHRHALDFDDLEAGALKLLEDPAIRDRWQGVISAVLVDEFQDTNARQRKIVDALCGEEPGRLFVVGDARQSIYRFRGADVTVFRRTEMDVVDRGGNTLELNLTFRAHEGLVSAFDSLVANAMGVEDDPERLYMVPYTSLHANRIAPREGTRPPYVEFILGLGERASDARPHAAGALVERLIELRDAGQIHTWDDVALLFRASTGFRYYEDALEARGIPYVTVAGRGFYDRPEIRDILNILRALAEPWNDLALAGLLRSPAFGLTDAALYLLRLGEDGFRPLNGAIYGDLEELTEQDRKHAYRARKFLDELGPMVDRMPVAELLKRVIDWLDYRAILAASHSRLWRNLDKLLTDAHVSGMVRVREFLEFLQTLRDVGVREGEAPAEAEGAVRLMTVHKAKGLEFEVVVIADASRRPRKGGEVAYLLPETGLAVKPDRVDGPPLIYGIAKWIDGLQTEAEEDRLLYVAATRAKEKLIISGHLTQRKGGWRVDGWMKQLLEVLDVDLVEVISEPGVWHHEALSNGEQVGIWVAPEIAGVEAIVEGAPVAWPTSQDKPLYESITLMEVEQADPDMDEEPARAWRATGERVHPPAVAIGRMVHEAIRCWLFPDDPGLEDLLEVEALSKGLVDIGQRRSAIHESKKLLKRLRAHPLWEEINSASDRLHEVPYTRPLKDGRMDSGRIDLLYRSNGPWKLIDFKTDELRDQKAIDGAVEEYTGQVTRYSQAVHHLLGAQPEVSLCFLDAQGEVELVPI